MDVVTCPSCGRKNRVPKEGPSAPRCGNCHNFIPWIVDANDADFHAIADQSPVPALVDLWATWCGPCRMVSPALERMATERAGRVKLVKVDIDRSPLTAQRFAVQAVPTLVVLWKGELIAEQTGAAPVNVLLEWLDEALRSVDDARQDQDQGVRT
jgi:thioredoxin 2